MYFINMYSIIYYPYLISIVFSLRNSQSYVILTPTTFLSMVKYLKSTDRVIHSTSCNSKVKILNILL